MARKPTISPSKITTYLACPVKYRWTYVDSRGKWYLRAKSYYSFGATLHQVLQRFHDSDDEGVSTTDQAMAAYEESWIDAGFNSAEEMAEAFGEGKLILERHIEEETRRPLTSRTLFVEKQLKMDFDSFELIGRIDRVDELEDGTLEIIDYKSGRFSVSEDDVSNDLALGCYQLLLKQKYPDRKIVATIVALRSGASATSSLGEQELIEFSRDIGVLGYNILNDEFYDRIPKPKALCGGCSRAKCDFLPLCLKHPDFADIYSAS